MLSEREAREIMSSGLLTSAYDAADVSIRDWCCHAQLAARRRLSGRTNRPLANAACTVLPDPLECEAFSRGRGGSGESARTLHKRRGEVMPYVAVHSSRADGAVGQTVIGEGVHVERTAPRATDARGICANAGVP